MTMEVDNNGGRKRTWFERREEKNKTKRKGESSEARVQARGERKRGKIEGKGRYAGRDGGKGQNPAKKNRR